MRVEGITASRVAAGLQRMQNTQDREIQRGDTAASHRANKWAKGGHCKGHRRPALPHPASPPHTHLCKKFTLPCTMRAAADTMILRKVGRSRAHSSQKVAANILAFLRDPRDDNKTMTMMQEENKRRQNTVSHRASNAGPL
jgi:hypothetical protein